MDEKRRDEVRSLVSKAVDAALTPLHAAVSKPAQKAYIGTALLALTSFFLLCLATLAYWLFYFNYVPQVGIERPIHLQFGDGNPYGFTTLSSAITFQQAYDVTIFLHVPRTDSNLAAGNFMVDVAFLGTSKPNTLDTTTPSPSRVNTSASILGHSRRSAILTHTSDLVDTANVLTGLPFYVLGWKTESETLAIPMFEGVQFAKGSANVPNGLRVILEADQKMQFYHAEVRIIARFGGLRWILYHHRILSFFLFTATFWSSSMISMLLVWFGLSMYMDAPPSVPPKEDPGSNDTTIKSEQTDDEAFDPASMADLSDTPRSFPTLGRRGPLRFEGKKEENAVVMKRESEALERMMRIPPHVGMEADDEGESEDRAGSEWRDSGIGTSREDERREEIRRRRRSQMGDSAAT